MADQERKQKPSDASQYGGTVIFRIPFSEFLARTRQAFASATSTAESIASATTPRRRRRPLVRRLPDAGPKDMIKSAQQGLPTARELYEEAQEEDQPITLKDAMRKAHSLRDSIASDITSHRFPEGPDSKMVE